MSLEPSLPKSIKVGGLLYVVEAGTDMPEDTAGEYSTKELYIHINPNNPPERQWSTLLHEIIHLVSAETGLGLKESAINALEFGLFQVLIDNDFQAAYADTRVRRETCSH